MTLRAAIAVTGPLTAPQLRVLGLRVHHGLVGCGLVVVGARRRRAWLLAVGALLVAHDLDDWPFALEWDVWLRSTAV